MKKRLQHLIGSLLEGMNFPTRFRLQNIIYYAKNVEYSIKDLHEAIRIAVKKELLKVGIELRCPYCGAHLGDLGVGDPLPEWILCQDCGRKVHIKDIETSQEIIFILTDKGKRFFLPKNILKHKLKKMYDQAIRATDSNAKGDLFEQFVREFFSTIEGFEVRPGRLHVGETELDVIIENRMLDDPLFSKFGPIIAVQCKNLATNKITPQIIEAVYRQAKMFGIMCNLAFIAATTTLTIEAKPKLKEINANKDVFIAIIDKNDWKEFFKNEELKPLEFVKQIIRDTPKKYRLPTRASKQSN